MSDFEYLGPYQIGKVIGRGGMGSVYEATHAQSSERVAVKLIAQHVADDMRFRRRFDAEVETLRRLRHPGIVRLIGYGEEQGRLFYAMELVHGESLQQRIREVKRMGWLPAVDIAIQITAALKHAHDIGVIHRDLKPANLLLTDDNQVKLVDFGIAKLFGFGEQTMAGSVLGTADYMAPEQAGEGAITPRTDLYALGSVMYAMMAGRSPFAGKKLTQVIEALKRDRAVPLDLINPDIPSEVVEIVHHLLEKAPQDRPPTALAVWKRLKATRAGLQREQTVALEDEITQSGTIEGLPLGESSDTQHTRATDRSQHDIASGVADRAAAQERTSSSHVSPRRRSLPPDEGQGNELETSATVHSESDRSGISSPSVHSLDFDTEAPVVSPTSFKTVEADESDSRVLGRTPVTESAHHWLQFLSIAGMLAILAGGVYLFVRATRPPTPGAMFTSLQTAQREGELTLHTAVIDRFLSEHPDDENADQVRRWQQEAELEQTLKRLTAQARRIGSSSKLDPASQGFLDAMQLRETSIPSAISHLRAWLDVFAPEGEVAESSETAQITRLVRDELARLESQDAQMLGNDPRVEILQQRVAASEKMEPAARAALLRGLIRLYQNDTWANQIVEQAKAKLQSQE